MTKTINCLVSFSGRFTARQLTAKFNEYIDIVFKNLSGFFTKNGFDPLKLDDIHEGFEWVSFVDETNAISSSIVRVAENFIDNVPWRARS